MAATILQGQQLDPASAGTAATSEQASQLYNCKMTGPFEGPSMALPVDDCRTDTRNALNFSRDWNHLKGLLKFRFLAHILQSFDSRVLGLALRNCMPNKFPVDPY